MISLVIVWIVGAQNGRTQLCLDGGERFHRVCRTDRIYPGMCPPDLVSRAVLDMHDRAFLNTDDHCAFRASLANVAPLRIAGENDVRVIGPDRVIVDMAQRPVIVACCL